jgi:rubrerythrin
MPARNPKEVFLMLLSNARQNTERAADVYQEISKAAENPDVREALESRAFGVKGEPFYERQQH